MADAALIVRSASKRFGDTAALDGVDLDVERGAWIGLLGPNGAGKTTLVRAITGLVRLDHGSIDVLGERVQPIHPRSGDVRRRIGLVPQEVAVHPTLTARENLLAYGRLHGVTRAKVGAKVDEALSWTGLEARADALVRGFSGGMKRRLNIAASVLHDPELLLLDEPTVGVDPQSRERIWTMLGELRDRGTTLVLTTHQLDEAQRVCQRIIVVDGGRVIAAGTFDELLRSTIGTERRVRLHFDEPLPAAGGREELEHDDDRRGGVCGVASVARELPELLAGRDRAGVRVTDLSVEALTLQGVFIHLTGRELRE